MEPAPAATTPAPVNPLHALHTTAEAEFQPYGDWVEIVSTFGEPQAEYSAIRKGAALMDLPQRGLLEFTGRDRLAFLNNLLTNQTFDKQTKTGLAPGSGIYAFFLNAKGRIVTDMNVLESPAGDRTWLDMDGRMVEPLRKAFDKYLFTEQVKMTNLAGTKQTLALIGPGAFDLLNQSAQPAVMLTAPLSVGLTSLLGIDVALFRDDVCGVPGFHLIVSTEQAALLWTRLLERFGQFDEQTRKRGLRPVGWAAFNTTRIEAGRPLFGIDFDDSVLPAELGPVTFSRAISVTKGCYLGQEIVARMYARQQLSRQLVGLKFGNNALPLAGAHLYDDAQNQVGGITSSTVSPVLSNAPIGLGYVKKLFIPLGSTLKAPAEGALHPATVSPLPFVTP